MTQLAWWLSALALLPAALYAMVIAPRRLRVIELDVPIEGLSPAFSGYAIGVLSDLHQAALPGLSHSRRAAQAVQRYRPDLIALLGDYAVSFRSFPGLSRRLYARDLPVLAPVLAALEAPDGVVALLGNHDYYADGAMTAIWLGALGARVLINERIEVQRGGATLAVAGVDDALEGRVDPAAGCAGLAAAVPRIVLSHNPDGLLAIDIARVRPALVLSGHTHGGQIRLPWYGAPLRWSRICGRSSASGWVPNDRAPLFVSAGVGSQIPLRIGTTPDVVIVRLRPA